MPSGNKMLVEMDWRTDELILQLDNLNISKLSLEYVKRTFYINRVAGCVRCFVLS